jgi:YD repeat-containing protein
VQLDAVGRPVQIVPPTGELTQYAYSNGFVTSMTDPLGRTTSYALDSLGFPTLVTLPVWHRPGHRRAALAGHELGSALPCGPAGPGHAASAGLGPAAGHCLAGGRPTGQGGLPGAALSVAAAATSRLNNRACLAGATPLRTPQGAKLIEDFRPGDVVLSRAEDQPLAAVDARVVEEVFVRTGVVVRLRVRGQQIGTTAEHPFWVAGKG